MSKSKTPGVRRLSIKGQIYAEWLDPDTGKFVRRNLTHHFGFRSKTAALDWCRNKSAELARQRADAERRGNRREIATSWPVIVAEYRDGYATTQTGPEAAQTSYASFLTGWLEYLGKAGVVIGADLKPRHLEHYLNWLKGERELAPASVNRHRTATWAMLNWARRHGYHKLTGDDLRDVKPLRVAKTLPQVLNREQLIALINAAVSHDSAVYFASRDTKSDYWRREHGKTVEASGSPRFTPAAPYLMLLMLTGCRPGEALTLTWDSVDLSDGFLRLTIIESKNNRQRNVPLHDSPLLVSLLRGLRLRRGSDRHVLGDNATGGPLCPVHMRKVLVRVAKMAGLSGVTPKTLRSTTVAHVASASPDSEYLLEARFGHGAQVSKQHYRRPLHGLADRGTVIEQWLGIERELRGAMVKLGYLPQSTMATEATG